MPRPDVIAPVKASPLSDLEARIGIPPLEELHAERDALVIRAAPLRARHGPGGVWDDQRRVLRSTIAMRLRGEAELASRKVTEAFLEDAAQADPLYGEFIAAGLREKAAWFELENQIMSITETINRGQVLARFATAELHLAD